MLRHTRLMWKFVNLLPYCPRYTKSKPLYGIKIDFISPYYYRRPYESSQEKHSVMWIRRINVPE